LCPRISHQLRGLSWPRILRKPVDNPPHPLLNYSIKPFERLTGLIAEDDLVNHRLEASLSLDLIPRDKYLARSDAGAGVAGGGGISEVFEELNEFIRRQPLQLSGNRCRDDRSYPLAVLGDVYDPAARSLMSRLGHAWRSLDRHIAHDL
jgi:hypothetical protein